MRRASFSGVRSRSQVRAGLISLDFLRPREVRKDSGKAKVGSMRIKKQLWALAAVFNASRACFKAVSGDFSDKAGPYGTKR